MQHVAIDLGSKESQVCVRGADGAIQHERKHRTERLGDFLRTVPKSRVILETSSEAFRVADAARAAGHEVRVVRATLAKQLGVGERGIKTDLRDARKLSEVSTRIDLPSVHIPTEEARTMRSIVRTRELLVSTRTRLINHVRGWMRGQLLRVRRGTTATLPDRVRAAGRERLQTFPSHIERMLVLIETATVELRSADQEMKQLVRANELCRRLMTVPGVGPVTALAFVAAIDDVTRFRHAYRVQSYLGLTPGEDSSSERERRTGITKAGAATVRRLLVQAAWVAYWKRPDEPMVQWAIQIAKRRNKFIAIVALARKLAGILFALWRDQTSYRADKATRPLEVNA